MIQGAIFDLDGTLFDSNPIWSNIGERYLLSLGITPKENLAEAFRTASLYQAARHIIDEYKVSLTADEIMDGINRLVEGFYLNEAPLKPGVYDFLKRLHKMDVKMCIATATDRHLVSAALERVGIAEFFSEIFTCNSVGASKDEPKIYREALAHLDTEKALTPVFEDSLFALNTAKSDGFKVVAVKDDEEKKPDAMRAAAHYYIESYGAVDGLFDFLAIW